MEKQDGMRSLPAFENVLSPAAAYNNSRQSFPLSRTQVGVIFGE